MAIMTVATEHSLPFAITAIVRQATARAELETGGSVAKILTGAERHTAAAEHHEQSASHHRLASKHYAEKDFAHAAHQALIAHGHTQLAVRNGNEATRYHLEHYEKEASS